MLFSRFRLGGDSIAVDVMGLVGDLIDTSSASFGNEKEAVALGNGYVQGKDTSAAVDQQVYVFVKSKRLSCQ